MSMEESLSTKIYSLLYLWIVSNECESWILAQSPINIFLYLCSFLLHCIYRCGVCGKLVDNHSFNKMSPAEKCYDRVCCKFGSGRLFVLRRVSTPDCNQVHLRRMDTRQWALHFVPLLLLWKCSGFADVYDGNNFQQVRYILCLCSSFYRAYSRLSLIWSSAALAFFYALTGIRKKNSQKRANKILQNWGRIFVMHIRYSS